LLLERIEGMWAPKCVCRDFIELRWIGCDVLAVSIRPPRKVEYVIESDGCDYECGARWRERCGKPSEPVGFEEIGASMG